jgi:hypothetical protein
MADDTNDKISSGILGLGGSEVPKEPGDPTTEHDAESEAKRRARMRQTEEEAGETAEWQHKGATGIDMGSGGQGTDVSGE